MTGSMICNYAYNTTIYVSDLKHPNIFKRLENDTATMVNWFRSNLMKFNGDKCHYMISKQNSTLSMKIDNNSSKERREEKLLGITLDKTLSFKSHLVTICQKASQKLHALSCTSTLLSFTKLKQIMQAFISSQFNYWPLVWMFCDRKINNKINHIHEKALWIASKDITNDWGPWDLPGLLCG